MNNSFKYNIETYLKDYGNNNLRFETHVFISYNGNRTYFFTGLNCDERTYSNYNREIYSIDPVHYGFDKSYKFKINWIKIILDDINIQSIANPKLDYISIAQNKINEDIARLDSFNSFSNLMDIFLIEKFRDYNPDLDVEDITPFYDDYSVYHRLIDFFIDNQLKNKILLLKDYYNLELILKGISNYQSGTKIYNLIGEFINFIDWTVKSKESLISDKDYKTLINIKNNSKYESIKI